MHDPLSADTVVSLKSDRCAALAASLILAGSFPELLAWAQRTIVPAAKPNGVCGSPGGAASPSSETRKANGAGASNGVKKVVRPPEPRAKGSSGSPNLREAAAEHDQALLALMQANPEATVTQLIEMNNRPRNSTQLSLERLEKAGLVEHASRGKWTVIDPDLLEAPAPKPAGWIEPLSASHVAKHSAAMRVPNRVTADA